MNLKYLKIFSFSLIFLVLISFLWYSYRVYASVNLTVTVISLAQCQDGIDNDGDGKIDYPNDPGCSSTTDTDETDVPTGGGGGGGGYVPPTIPTSVVFKGKAYPLSNITLLKDAQVAVTTKAGPDANFEISLSGLSAGIYTFGVWAEDAKGFRSITTSFTLSITANATTIISGIFLPPTIAIDKEEVKRGEILNIFGQSVPQAQITVFVNSEEIVKKTLADLVGSWLYTFDTIEIDYGSHSTRARAAKGEEISTFSQVVFFKVGEITKLKPELAECPPKADLNSDCKVNLVDFSIAAYWYKRPLSETFKTMEKERLNGDGKINLVDFSIMAYYWTG